MQEFDALLPVGQTMSLVVEMEGVQVQVTFRRVDDDRVQVSTDGTIVDTMLIDPE